MSLASGGARAVQQRYGVEDGAEAHAGQSWHGHQNGSAAQAHAGSVLLYALLLACTGQISVLQRVQVSLLLGACLPVCSCVPVIHVGLSRGVHVCLGAVVRLCVHVSLFVCLHVCVERVHHAHVDSSASESLAAILVVSLLLFQFYHADHAMPGHKASFALQINLQETGPQDEQHLQAALQQAASRPFDMATGPMINATLIPIEQHQEAAASEEHSLVISTHYSVTDGWSTDVLLRDLSRAYNMLKLREGGPLALTFYRPTKKYST